MNKVLVSLEEALMSTLADYGRMLLGRRCTCKEKPGLAGTPIHYTDHVSGWKVDGIENRQELTVVCPKCGFLWSFAILGIAGKATLEERRAEEKRRFYSK
ncbi:hypothetical protein KW798_00935 [Candidatus Parcubacteria bacterium]|nr:hypothetical protein [Candidatus Parcubacteria bacterium]